MYELRILTIIHYFNIVNLFNHVMNNVHCSLDVVDAVSSPASPSAVFFFFAWGWSTILYKLCLSISIRSMGGVVVSAIVGPHGYTNTLQTRLTGLSTGLLLSSQKTRSAGNGVANKEESFYQGDLKTMHVIGSKLAILKIRLYQICIRSLLEHFPSLCFCNCG